jgi:hypothetical protein
MVRSYNGTYLSLVNSQFHELSSLRFSKQRYKWPHSGNQKFKRRDCHRHFVQNPRHQPISEETKELIGFIKKKYLEPELPKSRGCPPAGCNTMFFSTISIRPPASSSKVKKRQANEPI